MKKKRIFVPINQIVSVIIFLAGLLNIVTALFLHHLPHIKLFNELFSLYFRHTARTFTLLSGLVLLTLSLNLFKKKQRAWRLSVLLVLTSVFSQVVHGFNPWQLIFLFILLWLLLITKNSFFVQSDRQKALTGLFRFLLVLAFLFVYAFLGFYLFQGEFSQPVTFKNIVDDYLFSIFGIGREVLLPQTHATRWFSDSLSVVAVAAFLSSLWLLFSPLIEVNKITQDECQLLRKLVLEKSENAVSYFLLTGEKQYLISPEQTAFIAYVTKNIFSVVLGDPIGINKQAKLTVANEFIKGTISKGLKPIFYNVSEAMLPFYKELGFKVLKIGEEALLLTDAFTIEGSVMADVRHEVSRFNREKGQFFWFSMDQIPWKYLNGIEQLHQTWVSKKNAPQLGFSLDFFPFPIEDKAFVLVIVGENGTIWGVLSFLPYCNYTAMALDFMIRAPNAPHGVIEAGIVEAVRFFKNMGIKQVNLGMAPLADITVKTNQNLTEKIRNQMLDKLNRFYQYKSLFKFKSKFNPKWQHKYLVYQHAVDLPAIMVAIVQAHLKEPIRFTDLLK